MNNMDSTGEKDFLYNFMYDLSHMTEDTEITPDERL